MAVDRSFWQEQVEESSGGGNQFLFFKEPKTRVRLIGVGDDPREWVRKIEGEYRGKPTLRYLVLGYEVKSSKADPDYAPELRGIVFPKSAWNSIASMMLDEEDGYNFFGPEGVGLTVIRQQTGQRTSYNVIPSPKVIEVDGSVAEAATSADLDKMLDDLNELQARNANTNDASPQSIADEIINSQPQDEDAW